MSRYLPDLKFLEKATTNISSLGLISMWKEL